MLLGFVKASRKKLWDGEGGEDRKRSNKRQKETILKQVAVCVCSQRPSPSLPASLVPRVTCSPATACFMQLPPSCHPTGWRERKPVISALGVGSRPSLPPYVQKILSEKLAGGTVTQGCVEQNPGLRMEM